MANPGVGRCDWHLLYLVSRILGRREGIGGGSRGCWDFILRTCLYILLYAHYVVLYYAPLPCTCYREIRPSLRADYLSQESMIQRCLYQRLRYALLGI